LHKFELIPADKSSYTRRKPIWGVGINDADYMTSLQKKDGHTRFSRYFLVWRNMITRCYSAKSLELYPKYKECTVCIEWQTFTTFKKWMVDQSWQGLCLDKDIILPNNKIYEPDNCCFVSYDLNNLIRDYTYNGYPRGVTPTKGKVTKYVVYCTSRGKNKNLGTYDSVKKANLAFCVHKLDLLRFYAKQQTDERIRRGLMLHAKLLMENTHARVSFKI